MSKDDGLRKVPVNLDADGVPEVQLLGHSHRFREQGRLVLVQIFEVAYLTSTRAASPRRG